jgi:CDP-2,3-bis-(O-geranylgeranyl)-sn-glycerol synthase
MGGQASRASPPGLVILRASQLVYFMAPAYVANMAAALARYWRGWNRPISARWLGTHKTVMGFVAGLVGALATTGVQQSIGWQTGIAVDDRWVELGLRFGVGAMAGDSAKSFVKRRLGIAPGRPWIPFDQLDFVLGALLLVGPRAALTPGDIAIVLGLTFGGHIVVNHVAYWLGIRDVKW